MILIKFPSRRDDDVEYYGLRIMRDEATVYPFPFPGCAQRGKKCQCSVKLKCHKKVMARDVGGLLDFLNFPESDRL